DWFSPMPTQDENVSPWPLCENLLARPCSPPLCARRPLRTPMSGAAWPEASPFPLIAPSIESSNPIVFFPRLLCLVFWASSGHQFYPNKEQNDRTDDRHNETRRMK